MQELSLILLVTADLLLTICAGALMAVEYINRDSNILGDYQLDLLVEDTECKVDIAMKHFLHYAVDGEHTVAGILGKYSVYLLYM